MKKREPLRDITLEGNAAGAAYTVAVSSAKSGNTQSISFSSGDFNRLPFLGTPAVVAAAEGLSAGECLNALYQVFSVDARLAKDIVSKLRFKTVDDKFSLDYDTAEDAAIEISKLIDLLDPSHKHAAVSFIFEQLHQVGFPVSSDIYFKTVFQDVFSEDRLHQIVSNQLVSRRGAIEVNDAKTLLGLRSDLALVIEPSAFQQAGWSDLLRVDIDILTIALNKLGNGDISIDLAKVIFFHAKFNEHSLKKEDLKKVVKCTKFYFSEFSSEEPARTNSDADGVLAFSTPCSFSGKNPDAGSHQPSLEVDSGPSATRIVVGGEPQGAKVGRFSSFFLDVVEGMLTMGGALVTILSTNILAYPLKGIEVSILPVSSNFGDMIHFLNAYEVKKLSTVAGLARSKLFGLLNPRYSLMAAGSKSFLTSLLKQNGLSNSYKLDAPPGELDSIIYSILHEASARRTEAGPSSTSLPGNDCNIVKATDGNGDHYMLTEAKVNVALNSDGTIANRIASIGLHWTTWQQWQKAVINMCPHISMDWKVLFESDSEREIKIHDFNLGYALESMSHVSINKKVMVGPLPAYGSPRDPGIGGAYPALQNYLGFMTAAGKNCNREILLYAKLMYLAQGLHISALDLLLSVVGEEIVKVQLNSYKPSLNNLKFQASVFVNELKRHTGITSITPKELEEPCTPQ